jgi:hypothetical protein
MATKKTDSTDYTMWLFHMHLGRKKKPLTVYRAAKGRVTVKYSDKTWREIDVVEAKAIVGDLVFRNRGRTTG